MKRFVAVMVLCLCALSLGVGLIFGIEPNEKSLSKDMTSSSQASTEATNSTYWPSSRAETPLGSGSQTSPYLISSVENLLWLKSQTEQNGSWTSGKYFKQTHNIDLSANNWLSIGTYSNSFQGNYNGDGFSIFGLNISSGSTVGLFAYAKNATFDGIIIRSGQIKQAAVFDGGAICGNATNTIFNRCANFASIEIAEGSSSRTRSNLGGIVGKLSVDAGQTSAITNCYNFGSIKNNNYYSGITFGNSSVGGIVASFTGGLTNRISENGSYKIVNFGKSAIYTNYNAGTIYSRDGGFTCGIAGNLSAVTNIRNNFNVGNISGGTSRGLFNLSSGLCSTYNSSNEVSYSWFVTSPYDNYTDANCGCDYGLYSDCNYGYGDQLYTIEYRDGKNDNYKLSSFASLAKNWSTFEGATFTHGGIKYNWSNYDLVSVSSVARYSQNWKIDANKNNGYPLLQVEKFVYNIEFDANGGVGTMSTVTNAVVGQSHILPKATYSRVGYTFSGWATSANGSKVYADGASISPSTAEGQTLTLYAVWTKNQLNLTINANGGTVNSSTIVGGYIDKEYSLPVPRRSGYEFKGWAIASGDGQLSSYGKVHEKSPDGFFSSSDNNIKVYNNSGNGTVTHEYINKPSDLNFPASSRVLQIKTAGTASPGFGGFTNSLPTYANGMFYSVIHAKIPKGYYLDFAANTHGEEGTWERRDYEYFLTSNQGTGNWETYVFKWVCGSSGKFESVGFFFLRGDVAPTAENPLVWQVAYVGTYDATGLDVTGQNTTQDTTFTFKTQNTTVVALWQKKYQLTVNDGLSSKSYEVKNNTLYGLTVPDRQGYIFNGWSISGGGSLINPNELANGMTFNGTSDYVSLGRKYMYTDKFVCSVWASMDDWNEMQTKYLRIISCTESGGWNMQVGNNGFIDFIACMQGSGYMEALSNMRWDALSSGWHNFVCVFTGNELALYLDDQLIATSPVFKNKAITYHPTNSIVIGAEPEAGDNIAGKYFKGQIKNVMILNDLANGVLNMTSQDQEQYFLTDYSDVTITANWIETWASSEAELAENNNTYLISTAEELAAVTRMSYYDGETFAGKTIKLNANIDLSGKYWLPIGINEEKAFEGVFDGGNYTISNIISFSDHDTLQDKTLFQNAALFGNALNATIKNVRLNDIDIAGEKMSAGMCAYARSCAIENCVIATGEIRTTLSTAGEAYAGGITASAEDLTITNCINQANLISRYFGGIAGAGSNVQITNCINFGTITNHASGNDYYYAGIVGRLSGSESRIENSINHGNIINNKSVDGTAGIVASIEASDVEIISCANYGDIISTDVAARFSAGIVARTWTNSGIKLLYCSTTGSMTSRGSAASGTSLLYNAGTVPTIIASYASMSVGSATTPTKQAYGTAADFNAGFRYDANINDGLPMQLTLFAIAEQMPEQTDVLSNALAGFTIS